MRSLKNRPASAGGVSTDQKQALRLISEVSDLMNCTELPGSLVKDPHMKIGIPREVHAGETRVARTPSQVPLLCKDGYSSRAALAFDARPLVREQVQGVGAGFLEMDLSENVETAGGYAKSTLTSLIQLVQQSASTPASDDQQRAASQVATTA